ncbi:hypothetical protein ACHAQA_007925 [Verticillium albo-atrum]
MSDSDDESLALSSHALAALAEFNAEKDAHKRRFEALNAKAEADAIADVPLSMAIFEEDWNKSQFWYSDETAMAYANELLRDADETDTVAVISTPSVFVALKNLLAKYSPDQPKPKVVLLEHDDRFKVFSEFIWYDFAQPFKMPAELKGTVTRIICDPPFLSEDCQTKGERMRDLVTKVYKSFGVKLTTYIPSHARGLSNEFYCYASYECELWKWQEDS